MTISEGIIRGRDFGDEPLVIVRHPLAGPVLIEACTWHGVSESEPALHIIGGGTFGRFLFTEMSPVVIRYCTFNCSGLAVLYGA